MSESDSTERSSRVDRLLDAIELIQSNRREEAIPVLRELIAEDGEDKANEEAWLWMSVVVDSMDKSIVCLDNVLRINPKNSQAAGALYRLREVEMGDERKRASLRQYRDMAFLVFWLLVVGIMYGILNSFWMMSSAK